MDISVPGTCWDWTCWVPTNRTDQHGKPTHMDGTNEIIAANRRNKYVGAKMMRDNVTWVADHVSAAMAADGYVPPTRPAIVGVTLVDGNLRRDASNVYGGLKWVLDGLTRPRGAQQVGAGLIVDDSPRWCVCEPQVAYTRNPDSIGVAIKVRYIDPDDIERMRTWIS